MRYGIRSNGNSHGVVLTKPIVVKAMLDRIGYSADIDLRDFKVIEPAAGNGAFAVAIIDRLYASSIKFGFSFQKALSNLVFFEIDKEMAALLNERIESRLNKYSSSVPPNLIRVEDFLLAKTWKCDLVIGNPPYVRHENIPQEQKRVYRKRFSTFRYRSDLYIAFYEKSLRTLKDQGTLSFICSNRWLKNQYGNGLRDLIHLSYSLVEIIDLENSSPFEEDVIAYPAITTIRNSKEQTVAGYYEIDDISKLNKLDHTAKSYRNLNISNTQNWFSYETGEASYTKFLDSIENQGFKIGIGVATGLDKVFIRKDFKSLVEDELLIPILTSKDLKNNHFKWSGNYILNPFDHNGKLIDLAKYPKAKDYFESKRSLLDKRYVAKKNPHFWYRTIDRIQPSLTNKDKIVLPDISGNIHLFIDRGNYYPHHNLYYISGNNYDKLVLLAALLMSDFVRNQLLELGTKMNGGYPRWQSQNLKKLRIPIIDAIPQKTSELLKEAYHSRDYETINKLITKEEISNYDFQFGQLKLFEPKPDAYS